MGLIYEMYKGGFLSPEQRQKVISSYTAWREDDQLKGKLKDKHRNFLDRIENGNTTGTLNGLAPPAPQYNLTNNSFI